MPQLHYFGHAAVGVRDASGSTLVVDPYNPGGFDGKMGYEPIPVQADYAVSSHEHFDHAAFEDLPGGKPVVVEEGMAGPFEIRRFTFAHDEYAGERFGGDVEALRIDVDDVSVLHLSDVGQSPAGAIPARMRGCDVALVPVGGFYTVGAAQAWEWTRRLGARVVIPIHFKTPVCGLPLHRLDPFLTYFSAVVELDDSFVELTNALRSFADSVMVIPPSCGELF